MGLLGASEIAEVQVLVVGAGPSGLLAAVELARHGVGARLVERAQAQPRQARATALQPGTLEILARAGVVDEVLASSVHPGYARLFDAALEQTAEQSFAGTGCPWQFQCSLPQWRTEQILAGRLTELGGVVERGVEVVSLADHDDGVVADLVRADGQQETVLARWVVGAGGAHSVTRGSMAEELAGETYPGTALVADVQVSCRLPRDGSALIASPEGYVLLAPLPGDRWLTFVGDLAGEEAGRLEHDVSVGAVRACIERRVPAGIRLDGVGWAATFRMHRRMAGRLAWHRRFLLGDAGHLSSPFGGEGLNSGLHDGANLAWKLALELRGRARPVLAGSYATERGAAARQILAVSDRVHEMAHAAVESARTGVRASPPSPEQAAALVRARSMLDCSYADSPLTGEYPASGREPGSPLAPGQRYPGCAELTGTAHHLLLFGDPPDASLAGLRRRWSGLVNVVRAAGDPGRAALGGPGAVLVRPDGYIGFCAVPADPAGIAAVDAHLRSYLVPA